MQTDLLRKIQALKVERCLHTIIFSATRKYTVRFAERIELKYGFRSSLIVLVDHMDALHERVRHYNPATNVHSDKAHCLVAVSLHSIVTKSQSELLGEIGAQLRQCRDVLTEEAKLALHYHIAKAIWPGINCQWESSIPSHPIPSCSVENLLSLFHLARCSHAEELGVLLTGRMEKQQRMVLDMPGGKRELPETSLECAVRETWEETGIDLGHAAMRPQLGGWAASPWTIMQRHVLQSMSCFVAYGADLLARLPYYHVRHVTA